MVIILPRPSKTAPCIWNTRDPLAPAATVSSSPSYSSRRSSRGPGRAAAFRARVYSFSLFKAPHLPRSRERTPDPADAADWIQMRLSGAGTAQRNSRRISGEKTGERETKKAIVAISSSCIRETWFTRDFKNLASFPSLRLSQVSTF